MSGSIKTEKLNPAELQFRGRTYANRPLLAGEISGVETNYVSVIKGKSHLPHPEENKLRVLFFIRGAGQVIAGSQAFAIREMAVFSPALQIPFTLSAGEQNLEYLEILMALHPTEIKEMKKSSQVYFLSYGQAKTYQEACKSEKTVSRTLVPEKTLTRFCMGSVQTTGPDLVGAHKHPMLEQHFFGLPGNQCIVKADETGAAFGEYVLLHIPLGSSHSVSVEEGKALHYLWLDFFRRQEDMGWITQSHIKNE